MRTIVFATAILMLIPTALAAPADVIRGIVCPVEDATLCQQYEGSYGIGQLRPCWGSPPTANVLGGAVWIIAHMADEATGGAVCGQSASEYAESYVGDYGVGQLRPCAQSAPGNNLIGYALWTAADATGTCGALP